MFPFLSLWTLGDPTSYYCIGANSHPLFFVTDWRNLQATKPMTVAKWTLHLIIWAMAPLSLSHLWSMVHGP